MPKHTQDSRPGLLSTKAVQISGMVDSVALSLLAKLVPRPVMAKSGWGIRAVECRTYGAQHHPPSVPQPFRAGLTFGPRPSGPKEAMGFLLRFSHAGTHETLALPALNPDFLYAALDATAFAAFVKESRKKRAGATKLHRNSGEARDQSRDSFTER